MKQMPEFLLIIPPACPQTSESCDPLDLPDGCKKLLFFLQDRALGIRSAIYYPKLLAGIQTLAHPDLGDFLVIALVANDFRDPTLTNKNSPFSEFASPLDAVPFGAE